MSIRLSHPSKIIKGEIDFGGSKSISNRALVIRYLTGEDFLISNSSKSDDTKSLDLILKNIKDTNDVHHAGTTFRFLTSVLALEPGVQILTGSERMKERPIGPLVEALRYLGCNIEYLGKEGYPPLSIGEPKETLTNKVSIAGDVSSQFISSLLLIAPILPGGLTINIEGELVSRPYLEMTLRIMEYFGVKHQWEGDNIKVDNQSYKPRPFYVESDWSSASYWYSIAALASEAEIIIKGLHPDSLQADFEISKITEKFGVTSDFNGEEVVLRKSSDNMPNFHEFNFLSCPDIAQTTFVLSAAKNVKGLYSGLKTLKVKETDRIHACNLELNKVGYFLSRVPQRFSKNKEEELYMLDGDLKVDLPQFDTYHDHRMAMAFAPLGMIGDIIINEEHVVSKSYPTFWTDLESVGFTIESI